MYFLIRGPAALATTIGSFVHSPFAMRAERIPISSPDAASMPPCLNQKSGEGCAAPLLLESAGSTAGSRTSKVEELETTVRSVRQKAPVKEHIGAKTVEIRAGKKPMRSLRTIRA